MKYFDQRFIQDGSRFQIWARKAGGNWQQIVNRDDRWEQLGPYDR